MQIRRCPIRRGRHPLVRSVDSLDCPNVVIHVCCTITYHNTLIFMLL
jgi:hypothetical protein